MQKQFKEKYSLFGLFEWLIDFLSGFQGCCVLLSSSDSRS